MTMITVFGKQIGGCFKVVEIYQGKQTFVTSAFAFKADADNAKRRMEKKGGVYAVVEIK